MPGSSRDPAPVLVIGEALVDVVRQVDGTAVEHPGGSPANVALGLARLGHDVALATRLGSDPFGAAITAHLHASGVRLVNPPDDEPTSSAQATIGANGAATYRFDVHWDLPTIDLTGVRHVHTGSIGAVLEPGGEIVLAALRAAAGSATISYDPNVRPALMGAPEPARRRIEEIIALSDVVKASDEDIAWLYPGRDIDEVLRHWGRLGATVTLATRGSAGVSLHVAATGTVELLPVLPVEVVDTVGAGDSFMSGLVSGLLDSGHLAGRTDIATAQQRLRAASPAELAPAVERAQRCSRITVSRAGANPPTRAELG